MLTNGKCLRCGKTLIKYQTKYCSKSCQQLGNTLRKGKKPANAFSKGQTAGEKNINLKGDSISYSSLHDWVNYNLGRPRLCDNCDTIEGKFEWANISGKYRRDLVDWIRLCTTCHKLIDNSMRGLNRAGGTPGRVWKR